MRHLNVVVVVTVLSSAIACEEPAPDKPYGWIEPLPPPPPGEGFQLAMKTTVPAGEEAWVCEIFPGLPADGVFQYVNRAESRQTGGMHHADVGTLFFTGLDLEPGQYDCAELYADNAELMEDAVFVYASQLAEDSLALGEGVAAALPVDSLYMYEIHFVNASDREMEVASYLNAWTIPKDDVTGNIYGNVNRDVDIHIPPGAVDHEEWTRCVFSEDADILFLSAHTHELAENFELRLFDGQLAGEVVYANDDWHAPEVKRMDPPLHIRAGQSFEYTCLYKNPGPNEVTWGFSASDEMCQFGYVFVPGDPDIECVTVETSDGLGLPEDATSE
jgi:hypothetical protein